MSQECPNKVLLTKYLNILSRDQKRWHFFKYMTNVFVQWLNEKNIERPKGNFSNVLKQAQDTFNVENVKFSKVSTNSRGRKDWSFCKNIFPQKN